MNYFEKKTNALNANKSITKVKNGTVLFEWKSLIKIK